MVAFGGKLVLRMYGSLSGASRLSAPLFGGSAIGGSTVDNNNSNNNIN